MAGFGLLSYKMSCHQCSNIFGKLNKYRVLLDHHTGSLSPVQCRCRSGLKDDNNLVHVLQFVVNKVEYISRMGMQ